MYKWQEIDSKTPIFCETISKIITSGPDIKFLQTETSR
jgi:hypothetical protein